MVLILDRSMASFLDPENIFREDVRREGNDGNAKAGEEVGEHGAVGKHWVSPPGVPLGPGIEQRWEFGHGITARVSQLGVKRTMRLGFLTLWYGGVPVRGRRWGPTRQEGRDGDEDEDGRRRPGNAEKGDYRAGAKSPSHIRTNNT